MHQATAYEYTTVWELRLQRHERGSTIYRTGTYLCPLQLPIQSVDVEDSV